MNKFSDLKTNTVYYSEFFKLRFPVIFETAKTNFEANGNKVKVIVGNQNIWIRDWSPIQVGDHFIRFRYKGYGESINPYKEYPWLQIPEKCYDPFHPLQESEIVLDGGGIIRSEKQSVITEKVFIDNPCIERDKLLIRLQLLLNTDIIIIPIEPGDNLGHADGICKFVDNETILINDYSSMGGEWADFENRLEAELYKAGLTVILMPYAYELCPQYEAIEFYKGYPFADDQNASWGYYINFTLTKNTIIAPIFGIEKDKEAIKVLKACYPKHNVVAVDCSELSMEGGLTNCTSANYIE